MDTIRNRLKHDYNLAVDCFNNKDYVSFFRNIRPAIELFCKLFIYDVINDQRTFDDIIQGRKTISKYFDGFSVMSSSSRRVPTGSAFAILLPKVYYYKHPEIYSSRGNTMQKSIRLGIDSASENLNNWYSVASEIGSHTGKASLDEETQARSCAAWWLGFIDFISANFILSKDNINFLSQLQKFSFSSVREKDLTQAQKQIKENEDLLKEKDDKISEQEATLLIMKKQLAEVEKYQLESKEKTSEIEKQLKEKEEEIDRLKELLEKQNIQEPEEIPEEVIPERSPSMLHQQNELTERLNITDWDVKEESMDDDQLDLIEATMDQSMLIAGCAGSGKSVIAMHKAKQLAESGFNVILIAYTKSLNGFMQIGSKEQCNYQFFYHYQWKRANMPSADYLIVDEIQDFDRNEIQEFINAAKKHFLFFGDSAQSIYKLFGKNTLSIEQISEMTGLTVLHLYNNYRLPRPVAKITQNYVGVDVMPYADKVYRNKEKSLPHFVSFPNAKSQIQAVSGIIKTHPSSSIGILLPTNKLVEQTCVLLKEAGVAFEYKFQIEEVTEKKFYGNLNFMTSLPKVMTYHSAKGLQFDIVILPMYMGASNDDDRKALYVAMTRTMHELYIMYSTPELLPPLKNVPSHLYKKEI